MILIAALILIGIVAYWLYLENTALSTSEHYVALGKLPAEFDGFKIVLISDLHGSWFGSGQSYLVSKLTEFDPDLIAISGDLFDERTYTMEPAMVLLEQLSKLSPTFYVTGNHEIWSGRFESVQETIGGYGIIILRNQIESYFKEDSKIYVAGLDDPSALSLNRKGQEEAYNDVLAKITEETGGGFTILLAHRPEFIDVYSSYEIDLVLSGHAHGGLIRLPFLGGLIAPSQGLRPRYTQGLYEMNQTSMIVSRGLGNSGFGQVRVFNRPEMVFIVLQTKQNQ